MWSYTTFKTSATELPADHHQNQLRLYAKAARTLGRNPVRMVIHDLSEDSGLRSEVEDAPSRREHFRS